MNDFLTSFLSIPSLSGHETAAGQLLQTYLCDLGWNVQTQEVSPGRHNIAVIFGTPKVLFTTHYDVVDAPPTLFNPQWRDDRLIARGSCDAKGIAYCMIEAARVLRGQGKSDFALLFVVGEEDDGIGAKAAAQWLAPLGIEYLVNGEPTGNKMVRAHKGVVECFIRWTGKSCHSGYPEHGDDANRKLISISNQIYNHYFGTDPCLGNSSVTIGLIRGGVGANIVSPSAEASVLIRSVKSCAETLGELRTIVGTSAEVVPHYLSEPSYLFAPADSETIVVAFGSDIPNFKSLNCKFLMCGPGDILRAHTDTEYITRSEIAEAIAHYTKLYFTLSA